MKKLIASGSTSQRVQVFIQNSASLVGAGLGGLVYNTSGLTAYYFRDGDSSTTAISLVTATLGTWASGGFVAVDGTNLPGVYEIGLPNACFGSGGSCVVYLQGAANMVPCVLEIQESNVPANITQIGGQAVALDGNNLLNVNVTDWNGNSITGGALPGVNVIKWNGNAAQNGGSGFPKVDASYIAGQAAALDANNFLKVDVADIGGVSTGTVMLSGTGVYSSASLANAPTGSGGPTTAQIATAVWHGPHQRRRLRDQWQHRKTSGHLHHAAVSGEHRRGDSIFGGDQLHDRITTHAKRISYPRSRRRLLQRRREGHHLHLLRRQPAEPHRGDDRPQREDLPGERERGRVQLQHRRRGVGWGERAADGLRRIIDNAHRRSGDRGDGV